MTRSVTGSHETAIVQIPWSKPRSNGELGRCTERQCLSNLTTFEGCWGEAVLDASQGRVFRGMFQAIPPSSYPRHLLRAGPCSFGATGTALLTATVSLASPAWPSLQGPRSPRGRQLEPIQMTKKMQEGTC